MAHASSALFFVPSRHQRPGRTIPIDHEEAALEGLGARLRAIYEQRTDNMLFVIGAPSPPYSAIIDVIDMAQSAGVDRVGIVTEGMRRVAGAVVG